MSEQDRGSVAKEKRPRDPEKWIHRPIEKYRKGEGATRTIEDLERQPRTRGTHEG